MRRPRLSSAAVVLFVLVASVLAGELPDRRTRFVATTNAGSESYQKWADLFIAFNSSWNVASAYCSSPGLVTNETVLPHPPFCFRNWTLPIRNALPDVLQIPIIQLLGNSGPENFKTPYIFTSKYAAWAEQYDFDGYLIDAEFKGDDDAFRAFLDVFGAALHAANRTLGVFLYPDIDKAPYVNASAGVDYFLGTWSGACKTIPDYIWGLHHSYLAKGNIMLYASDAKCTGTGVEEVFKTLVESDVKEIGFWANAAGLGGSWYSEMAHWLNGTNVTTLV